MIDDETSYQLERSKDHQGWSPICCEMIQNHFEWSTTVQNYAQLWSQRGPKKSQMVENSQNSITNLLREKIISATHGKKGI